MNKVYVNNTNTLEITEYEGGNCAVFIEQEKDGKTGIAALIQPNNGESGMELVEAARFIDGICQSLAAYFSENPEVYELIAAKRGIGESLFDEDDE